MKKIFRVFFVRTGDLVEKTGVNPHAIFYNTWVASGLCFPNHYRHVATVTSPDLESCFAMCSNDAPGRAGSWVDNPEVEAYVPSSRSMQVGDIVTYEGKVMLCSNNGWVEINHLPKVTPI